MKGVADRNADCHAVPCINQCVHTRASGLVQESATCHTVPSPQNILDPVRDVCLLQAEVWEGTEHIINVLGAPALQHIAEDQLNPF